MHDLSTTDVGDVVAVFGAGIEAVEAVGDAAVKVRSLWSVILRVLFVAAFLAALGGLAFWLRSRPAPDEGQPAG